MRIGIDARPLQAETQFRGIGTALQFFLETLADIPTSATYTFYIDPLSPIPAVLNRFEDARTVDVARRRLGTIKYIRAFVPLHRTIAPNPQDIDVLLQYDASLGVPTTVPTVTIFYDLIPYLFRDQEKKLSGRGLHRLKSSLAGAVYWRRYLRTIQLYGNAKKVIAISKSSKKDLLAHMPLLNGGDITVIYLGVDASFGKSPAGSLKVRTLAAKPYLLYVGGIDIRKNIVGLLEAFYTLKKNHPDLRLLLVGKEFSLSPQLADLGWYDVLNSSAAFAKDVVLPGYLSHDDLLYLYHHAGCFVFPSRYEGFGMPLLEAMQASCPVVAYSNSSIPEVAGNAALLVPDGESLVPAIHRILTDRTLSKRLVQAGHEQVTQFGWNDTITQTLAVLKDAANIQ